jgi:hypothetical protein
MPQRSHVLIGLIASNPSDLISEMPVSAKVFK